MADLPRSPSGGVEGLFMSKPSNTTSGSSTFANSSSSFSSTVVPFYHHGEFIGKVLREYAFGDIDEVGHRDNVCLESPDILSAAK